MTIERVYKFSDTDIKLLKEVIYNPCNECHSTCVDCLDYRKHRVAVAAAIQEGMSAIVNSIEVIDEMKQDIIRKKKTIQNIFNELPQEVQELLIKQNKEA